MSLSLGKSWYRTKPNRRRRLKYILAKRVNALTLKRERESRKQINKPDYISIYTHTHTHTEKKPRIVKIYLKNYPKFAISVYNDFWRVDLKYLF